MTKLDLKDKVALVTGAAGGLGKEFSKRMLKAGAKVCLADVNEKLGHETLREFQEEFGKPKVTFVKCDVTKEQSFRDAISHTLSAFSAPQLNILVNNAGVMGEKEGWRLCLDINLNGVLTGTNLAIEEEGRMSKSSGGAGGTVVQVSSILGLFHAKQPKGWAYNVGKAAVVSYVRCVGPAVEETGVRMLCLCPSVTRTPILDGCTQQELEQMKKDVGGFMEKEQVADAFESLLLEGKSGDVMACWKDCPPYLVPDTAFPIFIFFTICAMIYRFIPGFGSRSNKVLGPRHFIFAMALMILPGILGLLFFMLQ